MKKSACFLMLIPVILHAGGMMLICMFLQLSNHNRIEAILQNSSSRFEKMILTTEQFQKAQKNDKEILVNGKIFDIKEAHWNATTVELTVLHDSREEGLISLIEKFFDNENSGNDFSFQVLKLLVLVYTFSPVQFEFIQPYFAGSFMHHHSGNYISFAGETLSPPPDFLS